MEDENAALPAPGEGRSAARVQVCPLYRGTAVRRSQSTLQQMNVERRGTVLMRNRTTAWMGIVATVTLSLISSSSVGVATQRPTSETGPAGWAPGRTPWGDPDLQGIWT